MTTYIGIDPGIHGAIAALYENGALAIEDMPINEVKRNGKNKNEVSPQALADIIQTIVDSENPLNFHAYVERVNAMPGQGVSSVFSFGRSSGIVEGVLAGLRVPYSLVTPQAWQKGTQRRDGKDGSRMRAMEIFPLNSKDFKLVKDDGRAEAALIAEYARMTKGAWK